MFRLMGLGAGNNEPIWNFSDFQRANSGNSGNLLFNFALSQLLEIDGRKYLWSTGSEEINKEGAGLLIPMANNIGPHMDIGKSGPRLEGVNVRTVVVGLGGQWSTGDIDLSAPEGTLQWIRNVTKKAGHPNISVRGKLTFEFFQRHGLSEHAVILGCPSLLINPNHNLGMLLRRRLDASLQRGRFSYGVAAGNYALDNLSKLERWLISLCDSSGSRYIVQHPKPLIGLAEGFDDAVVDEDLLKIRERWFPELSISAMTQWFRDRSTTYTSVPQWILDAKKYDLMVGTRIHGVQVGIQAGTPSVCLYIDSRTKELCETMKIPHLCARDFQKRPNVGRLLDLLDNWDWTEFDKNRSRLARQYVEFFENNGVPIKQHLGSWAKE